MKVAILGVWHVHAVAYAKEAAALGEVIGFFEKEEAFALPFAEKTGLHRFPTREALLKSDAEGVIVCSATANHTEDILAAANAGKAIFTEKVLALTDDECDLLATAIERAGVPFVISFPQRYQASRIAVRRVALSGELGKLNYLRFRNCHSGSTKGWLPAHFYNARECGGGAMIDLGAHGMYLAEWILGMPVEAHSAFTVSYSGKDSKNTDGVEDNAVTVMKYESGAIAVNETGFVSDYAPMILEVHGEGGYVRAVGNSVVKCSAATEGREVPVEVGENLPSPLAQFMTGKQLDGCTLRDATALTRMMTLAYRH